MRIENLWREGLKKGWKERKRANWRRFFGADMVLLGIFGIIVLSITHIRSIPVFWWICLWITVIWGVIKRDNPAWFVPDNTPLAHPDSYWLEETCKTKYGDEKVRDYFIHDYTPRILFYWIWRLSAFFRQPRFKPDDPKAIKLVLIELGSLLSGERGRIAGEIATGLAQTGEQVEKLTHLVRRLEERVTEPGALDQENETLAEARRMFADHQAHIGVLEEQRERCNSALVEIEAFIARFRAALGLHDELLAIGQSRAVLVETKGRIVAIQSDLHQLQLLAESATAQLQDISTTISSRDSARDQVQRVMAMDPASPATVAALTER